MDDKKIIELYFARSESAIGETSKKYGRYIRYIAQTILENELDAEEIENDTYLRAWNTIPPTDPDPLKGYLAMLANRLALTRLRDMKRGKRGGGQVEEVLEELEGVLSDGGELAESAALRLSMNKFLASLDERTRDIFVRRYWYAAPVAEIAKEFGVGESYVTVLMLRTRKKLKRFLQEEGFEL